MVKHEKLKKKWIISEHSFLTGCLVWLSYFSLKLGFGILFESSLETVKQTVNTPKG